VTLTELGLEIAETIAIDKETLAMEAADAVRKYASSLPDLVLSVKGIQFMASTRRHFVHSVVVDTIDHTLASETPVMLVSFSVRPVYGRVVGQENEGGILYVAFDSKIYQDALPAQLKVDRGFLLHQLADGLDELGDLPPLSRTLFGDEVVGGLPIADPDSQKLADKLAAMKPPWCRLLWGPPGSGKSYAIGRLVRRLLEMDENETILVIAPSNRAVDVVLGHTVRHIERSDRLGTVLTSRKILRFGYPKLREILDRPDLLGPEDLEVTSRRIGELATKIREKERDQEPEAVLALIRSELIAAQVELKLLVEDHVARSRVVATTTTLAYMPSSPISRQHWSTVIIDEATMVPPAMCAYLGARAQSRFLVCGDPQQLGPVFEEGLSPSIGVSRWMGTDIFEACGISEVSEDGGYNVIHSEDSRLARITAQRRCARPIWKLVEQMYPTIQYCVDESDLPQLANTWPCPKEAIAVVDLSEDAKVRPRCTRIGSSWRNEHSAKFAIGIARHMAEACGENARVGIITPYRGQVKLLRQLAREFAAKDPVYKQIDVGTVHQFQGSDADAIVFDLVDGPGRSHLGQLLQGKQGIRLVNVAITRARGKFVLIADIKWYKKQERRDLANSLVSRILFTWENR
jgi:hypothetical protein